MKYSPLLSNAAGLELRERFGIINIYSYPLWSLGKVEMIAETGTVFIDVNGYIHIYDQASADAGFSPWSTITPGQYGLLVRAIVRGIEKRGMFIIDRVRKRYGL